MITCLFSCTQCGIVDQEVEVRARKPTEDVVTWMENIVGHTVKARHFLISPHCKATSVQNLKIPLDNTKDGYVGKQTKNIPPKG